MQAKNTKKIKKINIYQKQSIFEDFYPVDTKNYKGILARVIKMLILML